MGKRGKVPKNSFKDTNCGIMLTIRWSYISSFFGLGLKNVLDA